MSERPQQARMEVIRIPDEQARIDKATEVIARAANKKVLFLSGGKTPAPVYENLAGLVLAGQFRPVAVALTDERLDRSNEAMIRVTGLSDALEEKGIRFYHLRPIQAAGSEGERLANLYEGDIQYLLKNHKDNVGVFGIGKDGHTAGIAPNHEGFNNPLFTREYSGRLVGFCDDTARDFRRVTIMPEAVRKHFKTFIVLAWGEDKANVTREFRKEELQPIEQFPAAMLKEPGKETTLVTDQAA